MPSNISGSSKSSPEWFDAWRGVLFAHGQVIREIEKYLQAEHQLPLSWFDVLGRLASAPSARLRMSELSEAALFTRSGLTRLVDRIEEAGLVRRERIADDRRGVSVVLTAVWPREVRVGVRGPQGDCRTGVFEQDVAAAVAAGRQSARVFYS